MEEERREKELDAKEAQVKKELKEAEDREKKILA